MTSALPTARPTHAAIAWATKTEIFVEIPSIDGPPYIVRYHKSTAGLAAALNILIEKSETETRTIAREHPTIKRIVLPQPEFTDEQRSAARRALAQVMKTK